MMTLRPWRLGESNGLFVCSVSFVVNNAFQ